MANSAFLPLLLLLLLAASTLSNAAVSLNIVRADRKVDLTTQVARVSTTMRVENTGAEPASKLTLALTAEQSKKVAYMEIMMKEAKGKGKNVAITMSPLEVEEVLEQDTVTLYTVLLPMSLKQGEAINVEFYVALSHLMKPFPEEIGQSESQFVEYSDDAYILSPYPVKSQLSIFKLPSSRIESYTKAEATKVVDSEIRYGPFEGTKALASKPINLHFENNHPFAVVEELVREVEISHWGNVYVTENYRLGNEGARLKGSFSRYDYQARPGASGAASFRHLLARLPVRAHSVYYRDEIGNISTSHLRSDFRKTELELEPRYPLFGGWKVVFTLGYSVPLQDLVYRAPDGSRYLNISFGSPFNNVVVDKLILKVVLPEGSRDVSVSVPFNVEQWQEKKYSYLDTVGRTVAALSKQNSVLEHQFKYFQVYYRFNPLAMLVEPFMLVLGFLAFFAACIAYTHFDFTISKSTASYLAQVQREEVIDVLQRLQKVLTERSIVEERLDASLKDVARSGDITACKVARKNADDVWKRTSKDLKVLTDSLQSSVKTIPGKVSSVKPSALVTKVETLLVKEKELVEKLQQKQMTTVDAYERKLSSKDIDARIAPIQEKLDILKQEVSSLLSSLDD